MTIPEDFEGKKTQFNSSQHAMLNILEDIDLERTYLQESQRALLNILEDVKLEKERVISLNEQLEFSNKELESFSYSVSHDLRAPLRTIDGFSKALLEKFSDQLDEQGKHYLVRLRTNAQHLGHLIDDLLSLSRVSRQEMLNQNVNLSEIAHEIAANLTEVEPERKTNFKIAEQVTAYGDSRLLRIALENLFSNAWKFSSKRELSEIEFGFSNNDSGRIFFVRDNGVGFDMQYADKLFGAFQRLHTLKEFDGTGIGLATVQRMIHRHAGNIWAEASLDEGATFYFTLGENHGK